MISILPHQVKIAWYKPIKAAAIKTKMAPSDLAEKAGIARASLTKILNGRIGTRISTLFALLDALELSLWIVDKDGNSWRLKC